jgi:hypothetical protein
LLQWTRSFHDSFELLAGALDIDEDITWRKVEEDMLGEE